MKKSLLLFINLIFIGNLSFAQQVISGKVLDEKKQAAPFATIALLSAKDSSMVKANLTDADGNYTFDAVKNGKYLVAASMVGYNRLLSPTFLVENKAVQVPTLQLVASSKQLDEVTVTAQKPFLEQRIDKMIVNVASSPTAAGSTALEVLQKVPGLIIAQERITIAGKASVSIMIDGKPSQYTDMNQVLRDMPSNAIDKIEVIKNPSARYDASGGAVINIIMKRNADLGTNGSIGFSTRGSWFDNREVNRSANDFFGGLSPTLSVNHRKGKINVFGNYTYADRTYYELTKIDRTIGNDFFNNVTMMPNEAKVHNVRAGIDFYINRKNTFGILLTGFDRQGTGTNRALTNVYDATSKVLKNAFQTINEQPVSRSNIGYNLNWKHSFDTTGRELNVDLDYVTYHLKNQNLITVIDKDISRKTSQEVDNPVKFFTAKMDYTYPVNAHTKWETGAKVSFATIDNDLKFYQAQQLDVARSNVFNYKENINAAYVNFNTKLSEKWEIQTGLRAEQTIATGFSRAENKNVLDRNYLQLFPSVYLTRKINKNLALTTSFNRRIDRPSYQQQNPFQYQIDSLTYTKGNPLLKPQLTNEIKMQVTFDGQPFFALGYNKTDDVIIENAPQQDLETKRTFTTAQNLATYKNYFVELNFPLNIGKRISGFGGNQLIYNSYNANYLGATFDQGRVNWLAYINVNIKILKNLGAEINGWYMTHSQQEFMRLKPMGALTIGLQQKMFEGKGKLSLSFNDIFYTEKVSGTIEFQDINLGYYQRQASRNVRLSFNYSFGNQKLKATRNRKTGSESENNRVKAN